MKTLKEALITKKNISRVDTISNNKYGITKKDMIGRLKGFPVGIVVRMLEESEKQGNKADVILFQKHGRHHTDKNNGGFTWSETEDGHSFWNTLWGTRDFYPFYQKHPEYKLYDE